MKAQRRQVQDDDPQFARLSLCISIELQKCLTARSLSIRQLANNLNNAGVMVSARYIELLIHGERSPNAKMTEELCKALDATPIERMRLHRATCLDQGYAIGTIEGAVPR